VVSHLKELDKCLVSLSKGRCLAEGMRTYHDFHSEQNRQRTSNIKLGLVRATVVAA